MKFGKYLERHSVSEWKKKYVFYKQFKKQIKAIQRATNQEELTIQSPSEVELKAVPRRPSVTTETDEDNADTGSSVSKVDQVSAEETKFEKMLKEELDKVNGFFLLQENEFSKQFTEIKVRITMVNDSENLHRAGGDGEGSIGGHSGLSSSTIKNHHSFSQSISNLFRQPSIRKRFEYSNQAEHPVQPANEAQKKIAQAGTEETNWGGGPIKYSKIRRSLKRALEENYREIEILKDYVTLNHTAFRKIFKKYDKVLNRDTSPEFMKRINEQYFYKSQRVVAIERDIEQFYMNTFRNGNRRASMAKLRIPKNKHASPKVVFFTGNFLGMSIILFIFAVRYMVNEVPLLYFTPNFPIDFLSIFILHRFVFLPILLLWFMGILFYICNNKNLNLLMILGWDARTSITHYHILLLASVFTFLWSLSVFLYTYLGVHITGRLPILFPIILLFVVMGVLFCPFNILFRHSRFWLLNTFRRFFFAPFIPVKFKDFFLGDQLTSLSVIFSDFEYVLCFFVYDFWYGTDQCWTLNPIFKPVLISLPHLFRALQSIRRYRDTKQNIHMVNCGKYSMNILTIIASSVAHIGWTNSKAKTSTIVIWILIASVSTIYSCLWDFLMDWGLLRTNCRHFLLRHHLFYRHKNVYYFAMIANLLMRVSWAFNLSFESYPSKTKEIIVFVTSIIEVTRRFIWNFFRLENEHLNNCEKFKAFDLKIPETFPGFKKGDIISNLKENALNVRHSIDVHNLQDTDQEPIKIRKNTLSSSCNDLIHLQKESININNNNNNEINKI